MGKVAAYFELKALEAMADIHIDTGIKEAKAQSKAQAYDRQVKRKRNKVERQIPSYRLNRQRLIYNSFCPYKYKFELVDWAFSYFKGTAKSRYQRMNRKQLYAIWFKVQRESQSR